MQNKLLQSLIVLLFGPDFPDSWWKKKHCVVVLSMAASAGLPCDLPYAKPRPLAKAGCRLNRWNQAIQPRLSPITMHRDGLYPDHNGIVQNSFYDPKLDRSFRMGIASRAGFYFLGRRSHLGNRRETRSQNSCLFLGGTENNQRYRPERRKNLWRRISF